MSTELKRLFADCEVDVRKLTIEQAVTEIEQCMIGVSPGGSMEVMVSDAEVAANLLAWAKHSRYRIIGSTGDSVCQRIYLESQF